MINYSDKRMTNEEFFNSENYKRARQKAADEYNWYLKRKRRDQIFAYVMVAASIIVCGILLVW